MCIRDRYEPIGTDREGNEIQLFDVIETEGEDAHSKVELKEDIRMLYQRVEKELTPRERTVLKLRYGLYHEEEYTQKEIARRLGISRSYVSRICLLYTSAYVYQSGKIQKNAERKRSKSNEPAVTCIRGTGRQSSQTFDCGRYL